jgi:hypothetical protein
MQRYFSHLTSVHGHTAPSGRTARAAGVAALALIPSVAALGCGGGASTTSAARAPRAGAPAAQPAARPAAAPRLRIVSPRAGAHTGTTVRVRVQLTGAAGGGRAFRYVLDGREHRTGAARLTLRELAPGRHRLVVVLAGDPHVHAAIAFTVLAPVSTPAPASRAVENAAPAGTAPAQAPAPTAPAKSPARAPSTTHSERTRTEPRTSTEAAPPPAPEAIPQGNGGDRDGDNNGGPSDGDGNV